MPHGPPGTLSGDLNGGFGFVQNAGSFPGAVPLESRRPRGLRRWAPCGAPAVITMPRGRARCANRRPRDNAHWQVAKGRRGSGLFKVSNQLPQRSPPDVATCPAAGGTGASAPAKPAAGATGIDSESGLQRRLQLAATSFTGIL